MARKIDMNGKTLFDFVKQNGGIDISDTIFDFLNYFDFTKDSDDYYGKVMVWFAQNIKVVRYTNWSSGDQLECEITDFIEKSIKVFDGFMNEVYCDQYKPKNNPKVEFESDDFYDTYIVCFAEIINGLFSDKEYELLYNIIQKEQNK